jgi:8-oxo-dGTP pyrophosphatase MutT (NUDIX family)
VSLPVPVRPAATVVLLRDRPAPGRDPLQIFLQQRVTALAFAAGMTVFPGGGVGPGDRPDPARWTGPDRGWWARELGCSPDTAAALVCAAVRETFEECGVLLAGPGPVDAAARADLLARRQTLGEVLAAAGLPLAADLLAPWSRWVTPEAEARRYDTAFFVARLPDGQQADAHTTEAVAAGWWYPVDAVEQARHGHLRLMPPTRHTLEELAAYPDSAAVLAAAGTRPVRTYRPVLRREGERCVVVLPDDPDFRTELP